MCDLFYEYQAGHAYVDLGLSVKWATLNIGQKNVFDYGDRFAWGDSTPRLDDYNQWDEYKFLHPESHPLFSKYNTDLEYGPVDNLTRLEPEDDIANKLWGGFWRMPTALEFKELIDNCWCKWLRYQKDEFDVVDGFLFNSKVEGYQGRTLFLPGCGIVYDHSDDGMTEGTYNHYFYSDCFYWSSDLVGQEPSSPDRACMFFINKSPLGHPRIIFKQERRCIVASIRPVFSFNSELEMC